VWTQAKCVRLDMVISTNSSGTCFIQSSFWIKACILKSWVNGFCMTLKVPSIYHLLADWRRLSWSSVANMMWRLVPTVISPTKKSSHCRKSASIGGAKIFGVFRVKNHDFTPKKNHIFTNFRGGARTGCAPHLNLPLVTFCRCCNVIFYAIR
jgi:hypothetical protein